MTGLVSEVVARFSSTALDGTPFFRNEFYSRTFLMLIRWFSRKFMENALSQGSEDYDKKRYKVYSSIFNGIEGYNRILDLFGMNTAVLRIVYTKDPLLVRLVAGVGMVCYNLKIIQYLKVLSEFKNQPLPPILAGPSIILKLVHIVMVFFHAYQKPSITKKAHALALFIGFPIMPFFCKFMAAQLLYSEYNCLKDESLGIGYRIARIALPYFQRVF